MTPTTLAMIDVQENTLYLSKVDSLYKYFSVAHELRHAQLFKYHPYWFKNYKQSSEISVIDYNIQRVEVDANAYALVMMEDVFGMTPQFNELPEQIVKQIENRANKICDE